MHQIFNRDVGGRLWRADVGWPREIEWQDEGAIECANCFQLTILPARSTNREPQVELAGILIRSQRELLVRRIGDDKLALSDKGLEGGKCIVAFGRGELSLRSMSLPRFAIPLGIEHGLASEGDGAHGTAGETGST